MAGNPFKGCGLPRVYPSVFGNGPVKPGGTSSCNLTGRKTWDENIQHNAIFERRDAIYIPAEFILASDTVVGRKLQGTIQGNLVYPIIAG